MEKRKTNKEIIDSIMTALSSGPRSIHEIAKDTDINWESVKNHLETFKDIGIVNERLVGKKRVFSLERTLSENNSETLFGIPIDSKDNNIINFLFMRIRSLWFQKTGKYPGKTQVQKTLVEVNNKCSLNLPVVWYKFGKLCLKGYDQEIDYDYKESEIYNKAEIIGCVNKSVSSISKLSSTRQLKLHQYKEEGNELYMTKEKLITLLLYSKSIQAVKDSIPGLFMDMLKCIPNKDGKSQMIVDIVTDYYGTVIEVLNTNKEEDISVFMPDIVSSFEDVWNLIALYCLYDSLKDNPKYDYDNLFDYIRYHFDNHVFSIRMGVQTLGDLIVEDSDKESPEYKKLIELQGSAKKKQRERISNEERKQMAREMIRKKDSGKLFRESGLD